jgi:hypothetical protein
MSTVAVFLVLGGATAVAATHLGKNSVGARQLKRNAVTTTKIKDGAITASKIANGAVGGKQLVNGAPSSEKVDLTPFSRVVQRIEGTSSVPFATTNPAPYPLDDPTYVQPAGEVDQYVASFQVTFAAGCGGRRSAIAQLEIEPGQGTRPIQPMAEGIVEDEQAGEVTRTAQFSGTSLATYGFSTAAPSSPTPRTFSVKMIRSSCTTGGGITMDGAQIDVIGTR